MTTSRSQVIGITAAAFVIFAVFGINRYLVSQSGGAGDNVASVVNELSPSAAGAAAGLKSKLDGTKALGRVAGVYLELDNNFYISVERAPSVLRKTARRYVEIEFPESLVKDFDSSSVVVRAVDPNVEVGDVVEVRFTENTYAVGMENVTRVTQIVAPHDTDMARTYEQRIAARKTAVRALALQDKTQ
jgi:hypothetical protein